MGDNKCVFCTICSERYQSADSIHAATCGHAFHEECLQRWREESTTCPICRRQVRQYFQLYLDFDDFSSHDQGHGQTATSLSQSSSNIGTNNSNKNTTHNNNSIHYGVKSDESNCSDGANREFENLLYETGIYREEVDYLNQRISTLMLENSNLETMLRLQSGESETD